MDGPRASAAPIVAFDVGGTWFRSAVVGPDGEVLGQDRVPAASISRLPEASIEGLQQMLVEYLAAEGGRLASRVDTDAIAVSVGAAIDARSGLVVGASPLWGATGRLDFDLHLALAEALPDCAWTIVNDVDAAAFGVANRPEYRDLQRIAVLTVSSGLAMRTIEPPTGRIPVRPDSGLQGELGHLPASFALAGVAGPRRCDCGSHDHLSAFSSGRAIEAMLTELAAGGCEWLDGGPAPVEGLSAALEADVPAAAEFLRAVIAPVARALLTVLSVDAEVERIVLTGGVVDGLGDRYMSTLCGEMAAMGLYGSELRTAEDFAAVVQRVPARPSPNLQGAAQCVLRSQPAGAQRR